MNCILINESNDLHINSIPFHWVWETFINRFETTLVFKMFDQGQKLYELAKSC